MPYTPPPAKLDPADVWTYEKRFTNKGDGVKGLDLTSILKNRFDLGSVAIRDSIRAGEAKVYQPPSGKVWIIHWMGLNRTDAEPHFYNPSSGNQETVTIYDPSVDLIFIPSVPIPLNDAHAIRVVNPSSYLLYVGLQAVEVESSLLEELGLEVWNGLVSVPADSLVEVGVGAPSVLVHATSRGDGTNSGSVRRRIKVYGDFIRDETLESGTGDVRFNGAELFVAFHNHVLIYNHSASEIISMIAGWRFVG